MRNGWKLVDCPMCDNPVENDPWCPLCWGKGSIDKETAVEWKKASDEEDIEMEKEWQERKARMMQEASK